MQISLTGRSAIITGGSKGLGLAMATEFAASGADVVMVARGREALDEAVAAVRPKAKGKVAGVAADVATADGVKRAFAEAIAALGKVDIVVNNAGTSQTSPFEALTDEVMQHDLDLKLFGAIRLTRLAWPQMKERRWGRVINVLNIGAKAPRPASAPTSVSRAAGLALGIKLTVLAPLVILTVGLVVVAIRARRVRAALLWSAAVVLFGGYWLVRNWVIFGNPVPWTEVHLGPITLSAQLPTRPPLADVLGTWSTWDAYILPGFSKSLGRGWPVILALVLVGAVVAIVRGRDLLERFAGAAVTFLPTVSYFYQPQREASLR